MGEGPRPLEGTGVAGELGSEHTSKTADGELPRTGFGLRSAMAQMDRGNRFERSWWTYQKLRWSERGLGLPEFNLTPVAAKLREGSRAGGSGQTRSRGEPLRVQGG